MTKKEKKAVEAKREAQYAVAREIARAGVCPTCGAKLRQNLAIEGWVQCEQLGSPGFRKDSSKPSCDFQIFTTR